MRTYIFILIPVLLSLISCQEVGLQENTNDVSYIYFSKDATKDSTSISFKFFDTNIIEARVEVTISGKILTEDKEFTISAVLKETTLPADKYIIPEKYVFKAGQFKDTIRVKLVNFPELATNYKRLVLEVNEGETVKKGALENQRALLSVSDKVYQPEWWRVMDGGDKLFNIAEYFYVGSYSEKKMLMLLDEVDEGVELDGFNRDMLRKYALKLKNTIKKFNEDPENIANGLVPLMDEENGEPMTVPVN